MQAETRPQKLRPPPARGRMGVSMKFWLGLLIGIALLGWAVVCLPGCYPHDCKPNDPTCLPCTDPRTQNPACAPPWEPIPVDAKRPDGGPDR